MDRNEARTTVSLEVFLEWESGNRQARVSDLSLSGCFIDTIINIPPGEKISLKIKISDAEWISLQGEIVYVSAGCGFGVHFHSLSDEQKISIEHLILMHDGNPWATE